MRLARVARRRRGRGRRPAGRRRSARTRCRPRARRRARSSRRPAPRARRSGRAGRGTGCRAARCGARGRRRRRAATPRRPRTARCAGSPCARLLQQRRRDAARHVRARAVVHRVAGRARRGCARSSRRSWSCRSSRSRRPSRGRGRAPAARSRCGSMRSSSLPGRLVPPPRRLARDSAPAARATRDLGAQQRQDARSAGRSRSARRARAARSPGSVVIGSPSAYTSNGPVGRDLDLARAVHADGVLLHVLALEHLRQVSQEAPLRAPARRTRPRAGRRRGRRPAPCACRRRSSRCWRPRPCSPRSGARGRRGAR